uniref:Uncharacterized protein n=1 Tax=Klebsiella pneumoniae TaxID=573 RepID=A0A8B0SVY5_KLEPN|nr:hypothetical protein [Klebsiella pneumoniae]
MKNKKLASQCPPQKAIHPQGGQIASQLSYNWKLCTKKHTYKLSILFTFIYPHIFLKTQQKAHHYKNSVTMQIVVS